MITNYYHKILFSTHFDEGLDLGSLVELSLAHSLVNLARVTVDTGDESVSVLFFCRAVVEVSHDNGFASRVPATKDQYDFPCFHNFHHLGELCEQRNKTKLVVDHKIFFFYIYIIACLEKKKMYVYIIV